MLCAVVLQFILVIQQQESPAPYLRNRKQQKDCKYRHLCLSCKLFVVVTVKATDSRCLLLEELCHTDLIDQPAFLLCLVDHIARLAVADQKG